MIRVVRNLKSHKDLYLTAFYLGLTGYGGMAVVESIRRRYVTEKNIVSERTFLSALSLAQILPGSNIIDLIAFFSYLRAGLIGAIVATSIYILPTFVITTLAAALYFRFSNVSAVNHAVAGFNILLISLLVNALIHLGKTIFVRREKLDYRSMMIAAVCLGLSYFFNLNVLLLMAAAGILGVLLYTLTGFFPTAAAEMKVPDAVFFRRKKAWLLLLILIGLFSATVYFRSRPLWVLFYSFFRIGSLSFGGGIAAIPLIQNVFVRDLHLLSPSQFWDGIAISQITPGPILIASAFFGYRVAGVAGALVATIGMCIPSVILIILSGKIHARIRRNRIVRGVTRGFLAAFMGILAALIIGQMQKSLTAWPAAALALVTLVLMVKLKRGFLISLLLTLIYSFLMIR